MKKYIKELENYGETHINLTMMYDYLDVYKIYKQDNYILCAMKDNKAIFKVEVEKDKIVECLSTFKSIVKKDLELKDTYKSLKALKKEVTENSFNQLVEKYKDFTINKDCNLLSTIRILRFNPEVYILQYKYFKMNPSKKHGLANNLLIKEVYFTVNDDKCNIKYSKIQNGVKEIFID